MKKKRYNIIAKFMFGLALLISFWGCGEMFDDPTIDKDTGEDINLLIVDFNFFTTRMNFKLVDVENNAAINKSAIVWFSGKNASDIVNFAGEKRANYSVSTGQLELTVDPNVDINSSTPLEYAVHVQVEGYETLSQGIQVNSEGKKTYELLLSKAISDEEILIGTEDDDSFTFGFVQQGIKSALVQENAYKVSFSITKSDMLKFKGNDGQLLFNSEQELMAAYYADKTNFLKLRVEKSSDYPLVIDRIIIGGKPQMVSLQKLEKGIIASLVIGGRSVKSLNGGRIVSIAEYLENVKPDVFGFAEFSPEGWEIEGTELSHESIPSDYNLIKASLEALCHTGGTIKFIAGFKSSFSIDADIYDNQGQLLKTTNFKGQFAEAFVLENVPAQSAKVIFRDNNPAFQPINKLEVDNLCSGDHAVEVNKAEGYEEYQIVLKALCADNPTVAVAPTYSGEIRIKGSNDKWQGVDMIGGKADILAKPNQSYQIRLLWDDQWEYTYFSTKFDANGNYVNETDADIITEKLDDGRTRLLIKHTFEQSICDDMDW